MLGYDFKFIRFDFRIRSSSISRKFINHELIVT
jgi:hypothetical protein